MNEYERGMLDGLKAAIAALHRTTETLGRIACSDEEKFSLDAIGAVVEGLKEVAVQLEKKLESAH